MAQNETTPTEEQHEQSDKIFKDPVIVKLLSRVDKAGLNSKNMKAQIKLMAESGYSVDKIFTYMNDLVSKAEAQLQQQMASHKLKGGGVGGPVPAAGGPTKDQYGQTVPVTPYFELKPQVPTYAEIEAILMILIRLYSESIKTNSNAPFSWHASPLWQFIRDTRDSILYESKSLTKEEREILEVRGMFIKEQVEKITNKKTVGAAGGGEQQEQQEEKNEIDMDQYLQIVRDDSWAQAKLTPDQYNHWKNWRDFMTSLVIDKLNWLNAYRWVEILMPPTSAKNYMLSETQKSIIEFELFDTVQERKKYVDSLTPEQKEHLEKNYAPQSDQIKMLRKTPIFIHQYMHVWKQEDQKSAYYFFLQMSYDKTNS